MGLEDFGAKCCGGLVFGIVLYGLGIGLGGWNEYRNVATIKTISLAEDFHVPVTCGPPSAEHNSELLHFACAVSGETENLGVTTPGIPQGVKGFALKSHTEVYRVDRREEKVKCNSNDNSKKCTEVRYELGWFSNYESQVGTEDCRQQTGTECQEADPRTRYWWPDVEPFGEKTIEDHSEGAMVAEWKLPSDLLSHVWRAEPVIPSCPDTACPQGSNVQGQYLYYKYKENSQTINPEIGDVRVSFSAWGMGPDNKISVLAQQVSTDGLAPWISPYDKDYNIYDARNGVMTPQAMFEALREENAMLTWGLRLATLLMTCIGINCLLSPISAMGDLTEVIPILGDMISGLVDCALCLFSGCVGCMCWFFVAASCWVVYRPAVGIPLFIVSLLFCGIVVLWRTKYKEMGMKKSYDLEEAGGGSEMKPVTNPPPGFNFCPNCGQHKPANQQLCKACGQDDEA